MAEPSARVPTGLEEHTALPRDVLIFLIQLSVALNKTRACGIQILAGRAHAHHGRRCRSIGRGTPVTAVGTAASAG